MIPWQRSIRPVEAAEVVVVESRYREKLPLTGQPPENYALGCPRSRDDEPPKVMI